MFATRQTTRTPLVPRCAADVAFAKEAEEVPHLGFGCVRRLVQGDETMLEIDGGQRHQMRLGFVLFVIQPPERGGDVGLKAVRGRRGTRSRPTRW